MADHKKLSPSAAHRWMNCYGSVNLIGDDSSSAGEPAMRGTAAHKIIEVMGNNGETEAQPYFGKIILVKKDGDEETEIHDAADDISLTEDGKPRAGWFAFVADDKMIDGVQMFVDEVERAKLDLDHPKEINERFLDMSWLDDRLGGTADKTLVEAFGWAHLLDYKNGYVLVEVKDNEQMKNYAVGILHEHPDCEGVIVTIVQPNARHEDGFIRTERYTRDELKLFEIQMKQAADETSKPNAPLRAGDWCTWCPAKTRCKEFDAYAARSAAEDFGFSPEEGPLPDTIVTAFSGELKIDDTDFAALAHKASVIPLVDKWCREIEGAIQNALMNGSAVPGKKLVQGKSNRRWNPDVGVEQTINEQVPGFLLVDLYTEPKLKSPAQIEKLGKDKEQRKAMKSAVALCTIKPPGKLTVADESDPRAACSPTDAALDDFGDDPIGGDE